MTATVACNAMSHLHDRAFLPPSSSPAKLAIRFEEHAPCNFLYLHLHDAIREELVVLEEAVKVLLREEQPAALLGGLAALRERYKFLVSIYKYHSSVEDEVVYPALDAKVHNVTLAYTVEHEDEERLFEQLAQLLTEGLAQNGAQQAATVQALACKVEEIHTTLRKHLSKEEEQLLPLLLRHFSHAQQAQLVAQFLCTIPLASVEVVLSWLKPSVPASEQLSLRSKVSDVVEDSLLRQLLVTWLRPSLPTSQQPFSATTANRSTSSAVKAAPDATAGPSERASAVSAAADQAQQQPQQIDAANCSRSSSHPSEQTVVQHISDEPGMHVHPLQLSLPNLRTSNLSRDQPADGHPGAEQSRSRGIEGHSAAECCRLQLGDAACGAALECPQQFCSDAIPACSPIEDILHLHAAIRSALESFADSVRALQVAGHGEGCSKALETLIERHRFLRAVCACHSASEEEVLMPAARQLCQPGDAAFSNLQALEAEHSGEAAHFEEVGRLLREIKLLIRRHSKDAAGVTRQLVAAAEAVQQSLGRHMADEEATMFPLLQRHLCAAEQRAMVWRTVRAMPLRLLERVMPWLAAKLPEARVDEMVGNLREAASPGESPLVQLLAMWAARGRSALACKPRESDDPKLYENSTCRPPSTPTASDSQPPTKRQRTCQLEEDSSQELKLPTPSGAAAVDSRAAQHQHSDVNPIDHIFQFHKALRRDLLRMVADTKRFSAAVHSPPVQGAPSFAQMIVQLEGRFQFMWGLYRAHSHSEDEIVFPALERKEALVNVSHAYTLDHQQEEQLLRQTHQVIEALKAAKDIQQQRQLAQQLHRMSAALRATLEQHVQAEEQELWPLFAENFSREEQEALVGVIVGRTGAEVLASLLPWVAGSFTQEEHAGMMDSLRSATRNTGFDTWLETTLGNANVRSAAGSATASAPASADTATTAPSPRNGSGMMPDSKDVAGERADIASQQHHALASAGSTVSEFSSQGPLEAVAEYLAASAPKAAIPGAAPPPSQSLAGAFRPGWEDIFRMNQKTLEGAVRRMGADRSLEPARKAYLMQHIMASRYIVAQQQSKVVSASTSGGKQPLYRTYADDGKLGCKHYLRGAALLAPCCSNKKYTCRQCHDEAEDHLLDVKKVSSMACMHCGVVGSVAGDCAACSKKLAAYFCAICRLWDDTPGRQIYHCPYCNLCRRGAGLGLDACHCMQCNCCMHLVEFATHKCRDLSTCPVCTEYLFDSRQPYRELPCGHFMHSHCFAQYTRYNYTCPICSKSVGDMTVYFQMIDALIGSSGPLPPQYSSRVQPLLCNDCNTRSSAPFHFVYHKCSNCGSYNTKVLASADAS